MKPQTEENKMWYEKLMKEFKLDRAGKQMVQDFLNDENEKMSWWKEIYEGFESF